MPLEPDLLRLTERLMEFVYRESGLPMTICDETGTIVRATVRERIGTVHAGARRILRHETDEAAVTAEEAATNPLVREGYNCPIVIEGRRIGAFGVTGPLAVSRPMARVAAEMLSSWMKDLHHQMTLHETAQRVFTAIDDLVRRMERSRSAVRQIGDTMARAADEAVEKVGQAEAVLSTVQRIALQTRILSINGSVEATRAGERGAAFAVVAKDMTRLADETKVTSAAIQTTLTEITRAVRNVQEAVTQSSAAAVEQTRTLQEVQQSLASLKDALARLENSFDEVVTWKASGIQPSLTSAG